MNAGSLIRVCFAFVALSSASALSAQAATITETFPDPLGGFYDRWLGDNSNIGSYYLSSGDNCDVDYRGNNPEGLWISGNQVCGGGVFGTLVTIAFDPSFGATLTSLQFGLEAFATVDVRIYDMSNTLIASGTFSGGDFGFGHEDIISASSSNGISRFEIDSSAHDGTQVSGNTSVDDFIANQGVAVPDPAFSLFLLGTGLIGLLGLKRKA
jgi:hypothetical protein